MGDKSWSPPKEEDDYFSHASAVDSRNSTPGVPDAVSPGPAHRNDFDREGLTEALEKILKPEDHSGPHAMPELNLNLRIPRPVLRKNNYSYNPAEPIEGHAHPSEIEARNRAGRLAESVSGLASRTSVDEDDDRANMGTFDGVGLLHGTGAGTDARDYAAATGTAAEDDLDQSGLRFRQKVEADADRLVRSHTKRRGQIYDRNPLVPTPDAGIRSGIVTPVAYDLEFVPPAPAKYHGGILGTLLKLYNQEEKYGEGSGSSTQVNTPNRTPRPSPPTSAGPSRPSTPSGGRPRHGLFGLGSRNSASTLAELIGSSSSLAAPASSNKDFSDMVSEKLRVGRAGTGDRERDRPRKDKEHKRKTSKDSMKQQKMQQLLIKKHIAEIISRHRYLVKLCRALMEFGAPTHRLEAYMAMSARYVPPPTPSSHDRFRSALDAGRERKKQRKKKRLTDPEHRVLAIKGQFLYLPGCMIISFDDEETHTTEVKIVRSAQGVDLGKLRDAHEIYKLVVHDLISVDEAMSRLDCVVTTKPKFNKWYVVACLSLLFGTFPLIQSHLLLRPCHVALVLWAVRLSTVGNMSSLVRFLPGWFSFRGDGPCWWSPPRLRLMSGRDSLPLASGWSLLRDSLPYECPHPGRPRISVTRPLSSCLPIYLLDLATANEHHHVGSAFWSTALPHFVFVHSHSTADGLTCPLHSSWDASSA